MEKLKKVQKYSIHERDKEFKTFKLLIPKGTPFVIFENEDLNIWTNENEIEFNIQFDNAVYSSFNIQEKEFKRLLDLGIPHHDVDDDYTILDYDLEVEIF